MRTRRSSMAVALLGTLVGHGLTYALPHTDAGGRFHGYLHLVWPVVVVLGMAGLVGLVVAELRRGSPPALLQILRLQVGLFVLQEAAETAVAGGSLPGLFGDPALGIGVVIQVAVAVVATLAVRLATRTIASLAGPPPSLAIGPALGPALSDALVGGTPSYPLPRAPRAPPCRSVT